MPITKRIIDKRKKEKFMIDDAYLNGQAKLCGWQATLVYNSLCRHANKGQESFPSIKLISEELNISRPTVLKGLKNLEKYNVIIIEKQNHGMAGKWLNNSYVLLDKSEWKKDCGEKKSQRGKKSNRTKSGKFDNRVNVTDTAIKHAVSVTIQNRVNVTDTDRVNVTDTKETHKQGNTYKETHIAETSSAEEEIIPDLLCDKQKHIQIIGLWAQAKKIIFTGKDHQGSFIRRNVRAARNLVPYDINRIVEVMVYLVRNADFKATLETVGKYIDDDLATFGKKQIINLDNYK